MDLTMRFILIAALLATLGPGSAFADEQVIAPDWTLTTPSGQEVTLSEEVDDQTTIVLFWATWCPYCKALMPHLQSIRLEYGNDVKVLAISIRDDGDPVAFIENAGYDFTLLPNGDSVADLYDVRGTPGVFVVDQGSAVRFDLRRLPGIEPPDTGKPASNSRKAAFRAPYWAAEIRKSIDSVIDARIP
jgi:thiol-disulfide isomerase/thioredoxin